MCPTADPRPPTPDAPPWALAKQVLPTPSGVWPLTFAGAGALGKLLTFSVPWLIICKIGRGLLPAENTWARTDPRAHV